MSALKRAETTIFNLTRGGVSDAVSVVSTRPSTSATDKRWTRLTAADLRAVLTLVGDLRRRSKLATRYLKTVSSGQFVTASLVVAAIRTLDEREALPLVVKPKRGGKTR